MVSSQGINMSSSVSSPKKYDVYLNFRSEDVGNTFVSHLYEALCRNKIETYVDLDDYLERTENFSVGTMKAIDESKLSVIIFSENYASSAKCLDELMHILECKERMRQLVIPVYYHVDPYHIRKPHGSCEASFKNELDKVDKWRRALEAASDLSGWTSSTIKPESKLVEKIVEDIVQKLSHISSDNDSECLVGIDARTKKIESLLCIGSPDVRIVGIWGLGGIGKTTLASVVYNRLASQFESCHFLANVKEEARRHGLINLGNKLLAELLEEENQHFGPSTCSKEKLRRRKVLVVLDDVNNSNQFELLARDHDRFGYGSRIIVTTRDRQVLKNIGANEIYRIEELNYHEALQLFCSTAFRKGDFPTTDYMELSTEIVNYARGIPLPLKVLGSHFQFNRSREYWENELTKLRNVPNTVVADLLKIGFDALDDTRKDVFLDIACFLRDEKRDFVERVLDYQDFSINEALNDLRDRCLLTFDSSNKVQMHDLVAEMGHEIVRRESIMEPEKQNRLWNSEDVRYVFEHGLGTAAVEGLFLDLSEIDSKIHLKSTVFKDMANLKLLKIYFSNTKKLKLNILPRGLDALPDSLRYLHWDNYPVNSLPSNFLPGNLVELNMPCSKIEKLWDGHQDLGKLKKINLSYSVYLTQIPDLSRAPNLERIYLECCESLNEVPTHFRHLKELTILSLNGCSSLDKFPELPRSIKYLNMSKTNIKIVPSSIECLSSLTMLLLSDCKRLESLPTSFCKLKSLHCLNVSGCSKLLKLPEILEPMEDLRFLYLNNTAIRELPSSIENLIHLEALHLQMCESLKLFPSNIYKLNHLENLIASNCMELDALPPMSVGFQSLTRLNLSNCRMLDITDQLGFLSSLESLDLSGSIIDRVPKSIIKLSKLKYLDISNCRKLLALPEIPLFVEFVDAHGCTSLETVSSSKFALTKGWDRFPVSSEKLVFFNCLKLDQNARSNLITDARLRILRMAFISSLKSVPKYSSVSICYPGNQIPNWFNYRSMGSSIHVKLSPHWRNSNFLGFSLCVVAAPFSEHNDHPQIHFHCESSFRTKNGKANTFKCFLRGYSQDDDEDTTIIFRNSDHLFLWYDYGSYLHEMEDTFTEASFKFYPIDSWERKVNSCQVEKCGIHLLYLQEAARFGFINQGLLGESKLEPFAFSGESEVEASDSGTNDSNDGIKELEVEEDSIQNESEPSSGGNADSGIKEEGDDDNQQPKENYKRKSNSCGCLPFLSLIKENKERLGLNEAQLSRVYKVNALPIEEFDWKKLGTTKNLVDCGLFPIGASLPYSANRPSKPSSSKTKKKARKQKGAGASSSKSKKRKAPASPVVEPPSPEAESSPPPREDMTIGSGLRAPPTTLGSMARSKTPDNTPPSKGKEKVDASKKRNVAFEDVPISSTNSPAPQSSSQAKPLTESSAGANQADKAADIFDQLRQLPEKAGMSAAFVDRFTSEEAWEKMKRRSPKVAFTAAIRMLANTAAAAVLMYDPVLESMDEGEKAVKISQELEDLMKTREEENNFFESERKQLQEDLEKEKLEKEKLEKKIKTLEKAISEHADVLKKVAEEAGRKAVEDFKATEVKELEEKASDLASSTIIYNIFCEHPEFDFSILGLDVVELVQSWKDAEAGEKAAGAGTSTSAQ